MTILSKYCLEGFNCYEIAHTWTQSCLEAWKDVAVSSFKTAFKVYVPLYILTLLIKRRRKQRRQQTSLAEDLKRLFPELLRSILFLCTNGITFIMFFCLWRRYISSKVTITNAVFYPSTLCSALSVQIERRQRRRLLAVYMGTIAAETIYLMLKSRKFVRPLPYGEVVLFSLATGGFLWLHSLGQLDGSTEAAVKFFIGEPDQSQQLQHHQPMPASNDTNDMSSCSSGSSSSRPTHLYPSIKRLCVIFSTGYALQAAFRAAASLRKLWRRPAQLLRAACYHGDNIRLGLFLCLLAAVPRAIGLGQTSSQLRSLIAGLAAGLSLLAYRSSSIALYASGKLCEQLCRAGVAKGYLPPLPGADTALYAAATGIVLHCSVLEPHCLRPAYWRFLLRVCDKIVLINRRLLDVFGTEASKLYPEFWPSYCPGSTPLADGANTLLHLLQ